MKIKVSISMEDLTLKDVEDIIKNGTYRNKSHFIEFATKKYLKEVSNGKEL